MLRGHLWNLRIISQARTLSADILETRTGFIYLITLPLIFRSRVYSRFCRPFVLSGAAFEISFLMSLSLDSTKRVRFLPCKVITIKGRNFYVVFFRWLCFFLTEIVGGQISTEVNLGLLRDADLSFCATWRKMSNEIARKLMGGCVMMFKHVFQTIF